MKTEVIESTHFLKNFLRCMFFVQRTEQKQRNTISFLVSSHVKIFIYDIKFNQDVAHL